MSHSCESGTVLGPEDTSVSVVDMIPLPQWSLQSYQRRDFKHINVKIIYEGINNYKLYVL